MNFITNERARASNSRLVTQNFFSLTSVTVNLNLLSGASSGVKYDSDSSCPLNSLKLELLVIKRSKPLIDVVVAAAVATAIFRDGRLETNSGALCLEHIFSWSTPPALLPQANELCLTRYSN